jgi:hypothetical protein
MVNRRSWNGQVEETWAKTVFVCMVSGIIVGGPFASVWVGYFGDKAVGLAKYHMSPPVHSEPLPQSKSTT